ncbi:MAG TPA: DUF3141 domain-containing protein [Dokdonella sp.]|uniref:DUF3141 domain-containing protein n=1 Tax=Dokdonella sp. TaxID=2291710 RepID=UPI002C5F2CE4|nr:DUF3141 domain-containing protein [Dokdonella sp.]HUD40885.1 DUF3141 domain-containing protein [Dokdonella sp.]
MSVPDPAPLAAPAWPADPLQAAGAAAAYALDAWQRCVLYADVRRRRGNQYRAHLREKAPNVLNFPAEPVMSGLDLPRPVNYALLRIVPPVHAAEDPDKRPFVVVDPRAGHGPGIGGFKPDSEIGAALAAGHPCYFVGFLPDPVPGQTVEDVMHAEAAFVRRVAERHPRSCGKPAVIGNCQAGWQVLMTAAVWPELFGPIILAGAPLSYWAGDNPMRYGGGLVGGSWLTALTGDLGAGRFDGAWLVQNFENLDPANTLWSKQYHLYANVDSEGPRYLAFEKYWGGYVFLEDVEMQTIVDDLFIGNRLATAELVTREGVRIDLRNVRSPIVVFCSYGDNITPPAQALGWITDLYRNDEDVAGHDQTIVFSTHDSIGHLGIFVSASVGRKEHREFASNIELIDMLPAGVYRAEIEDRPEDAPPGDPAGDAYRMTVRRSGVDEVRGIVRPDPADERRFAAAANVSRIGLALYRNLFQPWVRAMVTPTGARWLQSLHPLRIGYEAWSDTHPAASLIAALAEGVRTHRLPIAADHPLLQLQEALSHSIETALDRYRDGRDQWQAIAFDTIYGSPLMQALAGFATGRSEPVRPHPGDSPEHRRWLADALGQARVRIASGGPVEAGVRAMLYVLGPRGRVDECLYHHAARLVSEHLDATDRASLRQTVRTQALLMRLDADAAVAAIPALLAASPPTSREAAAQRIGELAESAGPLSAEERRRLGRVLPLFTATRPARARTPAPAAATTDRAKTKVPRKKRRTGSPAAAGPRTPPAAPKPVRRRTPRRPGAG